MLQCLAAIVNYTAFCLYYSLWSQIDKSIYGCFHMTGEKLPYARKTTHFQRLRGVVHPFCFGGHFGFKATGRFKFKVVIRNELTVVKMVGTNHYV